MSATGLGDREPIIYTLKKYKTKNKQTNKQNKTKKGEEFQ